MNNSDKTYAGYQKSEWVKVDFGNNFFVSYSIIDDAIIKYTFEGQWKNHDVHKFSEIRNEIIEEFFSNKSFVEISDHEKISGYIPNHVSNLQKDYYLNDKSKCKGVIIYNTSFSMKTTYKLGLYIFEKKLNFPIRVAENYERAMQMAFDFLDNTDENEKVLKKLGLHKNSNWIIKDEENQVYVDIRAGKISIDKNYLYIKASGNIRENHILKVKEIFTDIFSNGNISDGFISIEEYSEIDKVKLGIVKRHVDVFDKIKEKYSIYPSNINVCGANNFIRAGFYITNWNKKGKIVFYKSLEEALEKINSQKENINSQKNNRKVEVKVSDIEKIVSILGALAFNELKEEDKITDGSPIKVVEEGIDIFKNEFHRMTKDITQVNKELSTLIEQVEVERDKALKSVEYRSNFLANMSHEIRTPMNGILGMVQLCLMSEVSEEVRENLEDVKICGNNLLAIIGDVLDFSKMDANKLNLNNKPFEIKKLLEESYNFFSVISNQKNISLEYDIDIEENQFLVGDQVRLNQIINNLVSNALKFTNQGRVCVKARLKDYTQDSLEKMLLNIEVSDTGMGISKQNQEFLFEKFSRGQAENKEEYEGTGLGLAISKKIAEMMGGDITFESEEGKGTTFKATLVFEKVEEAAKNVLETLEV